MDREVLRGGGGGGADYYRINVRPYLKQVFFGF